MPLRDSAESAGALMGSPRHPHSTHGAKGIYGLPLSHAGEARSPLIQNNSDLPHGPTGFLGGRLNVW